jgi:uncharacterized protein with GYD domain
MGYYMVQLTFASSSWAVMMNSIQDRMDSLRPVVERLGGKTHEAWLAFGEHDVIAILEMPDNVSAAAISISLSAGGSVKNVRTIPLLTFEEGVDAVKRAASAALLRATSSNNDGS